MKRIVSFLIAFLASAALCGSSAAQQKGGYATRTLTAASIESLSNSLCIELTLVDSSTPRAVVEIPQSIQEKVECRIVGTELRLRCRKGYDNCGSSSDPSADRELRHAPDKQYGSAYVEISQQASRRVGD